MYTQYNQVPGCFGNVSRRVWSNYNIANQKVLTPVKMVVRGPGCLGSATTSPSVSQASETSVVETICIILVLVVLRRRGSRDEGGFMPRGRSDHNASRLEWDRTGDGA